MSPGVARRWLRRLALGALLLACLGLLTAWLLTRPESTEATAEEGAALREAFGGEAPRRDFDGGRRQSMLLPMRDGVRIAVDLHLPDDLPAGRRLPAVLLPTRYWRRWEWRWPASLFQTPPSFTRLLVDHGYAVLAVDARGTGASFGTQPYPWAPEEVDDYLQLLDWIVDQPWSNGAAAISGVSYGGTCAEQVAARGHPALKAAVVEFGLHDVYDDIAYPGGVFNLGFVRRWGEFNAALDAGTLPEFLPWFARLLIRGCAPVDGPEGRTLLARAIQDHAANTDIHLAAASAPLRGETAVTQHGLAVNMDDFSPRTAWRRPATSPRPALLSVGGWLDGAYARSLLRRFQEVRDVPHRAILGAWNHGGGQDVDPFRPLDAPPSPSRKVQLLEQIRFLDHYCKGLGAAPAPELRYVRFGESAWRSTSQWPPRPGAEAPLRWLALAHGGEGPPRLEEREALGNGPPVVFQTGEPLSTGPLHRWKTQLGRDDVRGVAMPSAPGRATYDSAPLQRELLLEGSPLLEVALELGGNATDLTLFAYLLAEGPAGESSLLTEGMLRLALREAREDAPRPSSQGEDGLHPLPARAVRPLTPDTPTPVRLRLLPVAARLPAGWRTRLALAGCDAGQFSCLPAVAVPVRILPGSRLGLPVVADQPAAAN